MLGKGRKSIKAFHIQNIHPQVAGNWWIAALLRIHY
jgi:hypothetical protein